MRSLDAFLAIAQRDVQKLLYDRGRLLTSLILPFLVVVLLGNSFSRFGDDLGFDYLKFVYAGILAQSVFQSAGLGIVSLMDDRASDFTQELFVAPVRRSVIVLGKIVGESIAALVQGVGILALGPLIGVRYSLSLLPKLALALPAICLLGGAFGLLMVSISPSRRVADQLFPFVFFPQLFLGGVFNPVTGFPTWLDVVSHLAPLRYAADLMHDVFFPRGPAVADGASFDLVMMAALGVPFFLVGTWLFVRQERNR